MEGNIGNPVRVPTDDQVMGPFYPVIKPSDPGGDLTVIKGRSGKARGQVIYVMGQVLNLRGEPIPAVTIEIWQANTFGRYTHPSDTNPAPIDPNFNGYGIQTSDSEGRYMFKTVKPGAYPIPGGFVRPPHIHFCVTSKTNRLITQLYFDGEPMNDKDLFLSQTMNKKSLIIKLVPPTKDMETDALLAPWDITLGQM